MVKSTNEINKIIDDYLELAKKSFYITEAYLFGSYAKGTPHRYSDIDIALVSPDFEHIPENILLKILFRLARHVDTTIEPIALTEDEIHFPQIGTVSFDIANSGKKIL